MKFFKNFLVVFVMLFVGVTLFSCTLQNDAEAHVHEFGEWKVTKDATCTAEGEESRSCECGEVETRPIAKVDHEYGEWKETKAATCTADGEEMRSCANCTHFETRAIPHGHLLKHVGLVPATLTVLGAIDHDKCDRCGKLFDHEENELSADDVKLDSLIAKYVVDPVVASLNEYGDIQVYDGSVAIDKADIDNCYVFGVSAEGKIIYASRFGGEGYGGPSDGFYHDGNYVLKAGQVCGIFNVHADFAPWAPGAVEPTWQRFDVVAPAGGYVIAAKQDHIVDVVVALTGNADFAEETGNATFEALVDKGSLNGIDVAVAKGQEEAAVTFYVKGDLLAKKDAKADLSVYTEGKIDKADIDDKYLIAVKDGTIIYASRFGGDGYGGPTDGFYHDGNYKFEAGKVCGIFDVNEKCAPWPAKVTIDGVEVNAWTLYDVVVPEGAFIIAATRDAIKDLIIKLSGYEDFATETNNAFFENTQDGSLNDSVLIEAVLGAEEAAIYAKNVKVGLSYNGTISGDFTLLPNGKYRAVVEYEVEWANVQFVFNSKAGAEVLWYDNTTFTGLVTDAETVGCDWTANMYHESVGRFNFWKARKYIFIYDPSTKTLDVSLPGDIKVEYSGNKSGTFEDKGDGTLEAVVTLAQWQHIDLLLTDELGDQVVMWYDNTTFTGLVTTADSNGADWTENLYHEGDAKSLYCCVAECTYVLNYNPSTKTLTVSKYDPGLVDTNNYFVINGTDKVVMKDGITIHDDKTPKMIKDDLGEYTIAIDSTGKIIFASRTSEGYGGATDGFYHDGSYEFVAGQVCGIFDINEHCAPWPAKVTIEGSEVGAWTLFSIVVPTGAHLITGSQEAMSNLIKKLCNIETFNESGNALFEGLVKGSLTQLITFEFAE